MALPEFVIAAIISILLTFSVCASDDFADQESKLAEIQKRIKRVSLSIDGLQLQKDSLLAQLADAEKQYGQITAELKALLQEVKQKQHFLETTQKNIQRQKEKIGKQHNELEGLVRSAYAMGQKERLKLILNQQDPALSSRVVVYYEYLNRDRLERILEINAILNNLAELEQDKKSEATRLEQILAKKKIEQEKLAGTKKARELILARLNKESSSRKKQLHRLQESEKRLKSLLVSLQEAMSDFPFQAGPAKPFHQLRGQLAWPVRGKLVKKYGSKRANRHWDGVLIGAREGTEVYAVTRGRIVYADWLKGYGLLIIIDHGKGFMTIYAFNRGLLKGVGDWVDAGDIIAEVGKSNGRNQAGLYFGIRKKGNPVDPEKWCRKIRNGRVS